MRRVIGLVLQLIGILTGEVRSIATITLTLCNHCGEVMVYDPELDAEYCARVWTHWIDSEWGTSA